MIENNHDFIDELKKNITSHSGLYELEKFGNLFTSRPLNATEMKKFMATLWAFYKETPRGMLDLALKIADLWATIDPWEANALVAHLLYANVDEFGLNTIREKINPSHHQLFKMSADFFEVSTEDLQSQQNVLSGGYEIGKVSYECYRLKPISIGLGFHLASELTSGLEFTYFLNGFLAHKDHYSLSTRDDSVLEFFYIHTVVESEHLNHSEQLVLRFINKFPGSKLEIFSGVQIYMESYKNLFKSLNEEIFLCRN